MINKNLQNLLVLFVAVLSIFVAIKSYNGLQESKYIGNDVVPVNTISVNATGEVFAKPDIAQISISVEKLAKTAIDAQKQATEAINKVTKFLKDSGIEDKDIKTVSYNIYPEYDYLSDTGRVFKGYRVYQSLEVKVRKIDDAGKILAGATEAGANQIGGINFTIDDEDTLKREARQQAIDKAKEKAGQLAKDLGIDLLRLVSFSESNGYYPIMYKAMESGMDGIGGGGAPDMPAGENKISVTVNLTYEIK